MSFNDSRIFDKELTDTLFTYISKELKDIIELAIQTHNFKPIKELLEFIKQNKFNEKK